ncbi:MAG: glycosyltransferase [Pseudomonadota bacterium]
MPSILFVHENFPAQFGGLAQHLARLGWTVVFATASDTIPDDGHAHSPINGVSVVRYSRRRNAARTSHHYLKTTEQAVLNGQGFARLAARLAAGGFNPDLIVAHSGWGSGSFAKVVWPEAHFVQYLEWWYNSSPVDLSEDARAALSEDEVAATLCRNLPFLIDAQSADAIWVPTQFQADQLPRFLRHRVTVLHDGVSAEQFSPVPEGQKRPAIEGVPENAPVVTYATRGMEPMRGFPQFMSAWEEVQNRRPDAHCVIAGQDKVNYGEQLPKNDSYLGRALSQHSFDQSRLHLMGLLPKSVYAKLLQRSCVHVYLTQPFVLSWSLIEAMLSGCPLVVSDTAPVREVVPAQAARFVNHDKACEIANAVDEVLNDGPASAQRVDIARQHAQASYSTKVLRPRQVAFLIGLLDQSGAREAAE